MMALLVLYLILSHHYCIEPSLHHYLQSVISNPSVDWKLCIISWLLSTPNVLANTHCPSLLITINHIICHLPDVWPGVLSGLTMDSHNIHLYSTPPHTKQILTQNQEKYYFILLFDMIDFFCYYLLILLW